MGWVDEKLGTFPTALIIPGFKGKLSSALGEAEAGRALPLILIPWETPSLQTSTWELPMDGGGQAPAGPPPWSQGVKTGEGVQPNPALALILYRMSSKRDSAQGYKVERRPKRQSCVFPQPLLSNSTWDGEICFPATRTVLF